MWRIRYLISTLRDDEGIGVVEIILILVVRFTVYYEICIGCIT